LPVGPDTERAGKRERIAAKSKAPLIVMELTAMPFFLIRTDAPPFSLYLKLHHKNGRLHVAKSYKEEANQVKRVHSISLWAKARHSLPSNNLPCNG
jgi:hypothetical protein